MATKNTTKAELEAKIAELEAKLAAQNTTTVTTTPVVNAQPVTFTVPNTDITLVYCSDSLGFAAISNMELHFNRFGEEFILTRSQFDELVGKYRSWFDRGILAVSYKNIDVAASKGLHTDKEYGLSFDTLESISRMNPNQIEKLWNDTPIRAHKESIVSYYKRKFIEGDVNFTDRAKVDLMNRLTNGGFAREVDELSGRYKITPTEM